MRLFFALLLIAPVAAAQTPVPENSLAAYQSARLYIEGLETVTADAGGRVLNTTRTWHVLKGDERISEGEFYSLVGRDDLAEEAFHRNRTKQTTQTFGILASAAGLGIMLVGAYQQIKESQRDLLDPDYNPDAGLPAALGGGTVALAGSGLLWWSQSLSRKRETHVQAAAEMAAAYNAQLDRARSEAEADDGIRDTEPQP